MSNNVKNTLIVLGASDPEMVAVASLFTDAGCRVVEAVGIDGKRVHPGNAYKGRCPVDPLNYDRIVLIECEVPLPSGLEKVVIDHHRPGDPGFGLPPSQFLLASSLGQSLVFLAEQTGGDPADTICSADKEIRMIAAADHCLAAAYRGECPGVDPNELMKWRARSRAAFQKRSVEDVLRDVEAARLRLRSAAALDADTGVQPEISDLRGENIPELPEAAAREGIAFLADQADRDGRRKVVLMAASEKLVRRFLAGEIIPGLIDYYGDPARGFAGGYYPPDVYPDSGFGTVPSH